MGFNSGFKGLMYFQTKTPRTRLHFSHPSNSFKISSRQKFNYCTLNHSRTEIPTSCCGIGGLPSARLFSKISSFAVFALSLYSKCRTDQYSKCRADQYSKCRTDQYSKCRTDQYSKCRTDQYSKCRTDQYLDLRGTR